MCWRRVECKFRRKFEKYCKQKTRKVNNCHDYDTYLILKNFFTSTIYFSLVAIVKPIQAESSKEYSEDETITLSTLPSPMERSGSIVGDQQLPVPAEFSDGPSCDDEEEEGEKVKKN